MTYLLALDQGTSSSRSIIFDERGHIVAQAQLELPQIYPQPGWVEHNPLEIWRTQLTTARDALAKAGIAASAVRAVGITNQRETLHADGKARIARAVAEQVPNDCSLILNIGTTTEAIAKALLHHRGLRVITNNLNVAAILSSNPECEVIVAGGVVRARDRGIVGEAAVDFIRQFRVDIALIGISGIEPDGSLRDFDYREVKVAQTIIEHAREVWLAADHSKFNRPAMVQLATLPQIDRLFTDAPPPEPFPALLQEAEVALTIVAAEQSS